MSEFVAGGIPAGTRFHFAELEDDDAASALLFLAHDTAGEVVDIIAWRRGSGGFLASWLGNVSCLGEEQILSEHRGPGDAITIHADPLDWIRAGRRGIVIVDRTMALPLLRQAEPFAMADPIAAERMRRDLTTAPPMILSGEDVAARAYRSAAVSWH